MSKFLVEITSISGPTTYAGFQRRIECTAMRHAMSLSVSNNAATRTGGVSTHGSVEFTHAIDKATPGLRGAMAKSTNLGKVTIDRVKTVAGSLSSVEKWELQGAILTRLELDTPLDSDSNLPGTPQEKFQLSYTGIQWSFLEDNANITAAYSFTTGQTENIAAA